MKALQPHLLELKKQSILQLIKNPNWIESKITMLNACIRALIAPIPMAILYYTDET